MLRTMATIATIEMGAADSITMANTMLTLIDVFITILAHPA